MSSLFDGAIDVLNRRPADTPDCVSVDHRIHVELESVNGISRTFFDELGGFDDTIVGYGGEDGDLAYTSGADLVHEPTARFRHDGPDWANRGSGP